MALISSNRHLTITVSAMARSYHLNDLMFKLNVYRQVYVFNQLYQYGYCSLNKVAIGLRSRAKSLIDLD